MTIQMHDFPMVAGAIAGRHPVAFRSGHRKLSGLLHRPAGPRAAAVLHGTLGVPQEAYAGFADWLSGQGIACLTYDYRDFGASGGAGLRRSDATLADWGVTDQVAALAALRGLMPGLPLWIIGHGAGGMLLPFQAGRAGGAEFDGVERAILIAAGAVHVADHPWPRRMLARLLWQGHGPLLTRALGYLPGRFSGLGADLPAGVFRQWRRWCLTPGHALADAGTLLPVPDWQAFRAPMKFVAVADDRQVPPAAVWRLMRYYPEAVKRQLTLHPDRLGGAAIGHLGLFSPANARLWPLLIA